MQKSIKDNHLRSIFSLWTDWLTATGALTLLIVLDLWVPRVWHPVVAIVLDILLVTIMRRQSQQKSPACSLMEHLASRTLFWTAVVMVVNIVAYDQGWVNMFFDPDLLNADMSFLTVLIVAPIASVVAYIAYRRGQELAYCKACIRRNGLSVERGFVGRTYSQENRYQLRLMVIVYSLLSVTVWAYYLISYINVNLNSADKFVFIWIPVLVYIIVGIHCGIRYAGVWNYYNQNLEGSWQRQGRYTRTRMIVIYEDKIMVKVPDESADLAPVERKMDTPFKLMVPFRSTMSRDEGYKIFTNFTRMQGLDIRYMYSNGIGNADFNIFHFLCFPTPSQKKELDERYPSAVWMTAEELDVMSEKGLFSPFFTAELYRLYKVAMAWKSYSHDGRRLYKIKHYRPSFRLRDVKEWEVDYDDPNWLYVSDNNEDVPFWKLREFWRKYVMGLIE